MKKFYNRENELKLLKKADKLKEKHSIMTLLIGRRRVGKTALALQNYTKDKRLYLFVSKKDEKLLAQEFYEEVELQLDIKTFGNIDSFESFFKFIFELGKKESFTLVVDEFQELGKINSSIYSTLQKLWDSYKDSTNIHFIASGSIYSLMKKIYQDSSEPLFGRADFIIDLQPFTPSTIKEILQDNKAFSAENFLDFYTITGGLAKYVELFTIYESFDFESMLNDIIQPNSLFLQEGKNRLIEEFGKEYEVYFSILSLIASSKTSRGEIESILGKNISGHLDRLENSYNIIKSIKPIGAKPNAKVKKYEIVDNFLAFWFRFIFKYQSLIEAKNFDRLSMIIKRDFPTFKGRFLEKLFIEIFKEKQIYTQIGSYWERGNKNEIDIVAVDEFEKKLLICEVKLQEKRLNKNELILKSAKLLDKYRDYDVEYRLLCLDNLSSY